MVERNTSCPSTLHRRNAVATTDEDRLREVLDEAECRRLLATTQAGRLGFTDAALPAIDPVSFTVEDGHVLIPARMGSPVVDAVRGSVVALQADTYDPDARTGWSVTVVGPSRIITHPGKVPDLHGMGASARPALLDSCYISIQMGLLRGWRMTSRPTPPAPAVARGSGGLPAL
jgi:uncharacterized protein